MPIPNPEPGLVISYAYLWHHEHEAGRDEGQKDRPSVIVRAVERETDGAIIVTVLPITHSAPRDRPPPSKCRRRSSSISVSTTIRRGYIASRGSRRRCRMDVDDYYPQGKRWWVRLHEKGGKQHEMPAHHLLEHYMDDYVTAAGLAGKKNVPLFRTLGGRGRKELTGDRMTRQDARRMIVRRTKKPGC